LLKLQVQNDSKDLEPDDPDDSDYSYAASNGASSGSEEGEQSPDDSERKSRAAFKDISALPYVVTEYFEEPGKETYGEELLRQSNNRVYKFSLLR
jgi:hypothetical protein